MIEKVSYRLLIDREESLLFDYYVSHSVFTPSSRCVVLTNKTFQIGQELYLELGINESLNKVFKGKIYKIEKYQDRYKLFADSLYDLRNNLIYTSLKDVNPKQILGYLGLKNLVYTNKNLQEKHHFPVLGLTPLQTIKHILKVWNLKGFVFYLDLDDKFHFHHIDEYWDKKIQTNRIIKQNKLNEISMPLFTGIFINEILETHQGSFKVLSITYTKGKTYLEIENA